MKSDLRLFRTLAIVISLGGAVSLVGGCGSTPKQESTGEYFDDTAITAKVKAEFIADKTVSAAAINVETFKGIVQLSGFAKSAAEVDRAVMLAKNVKGVKSVKNDIRMK